MGILNTLAGWAKSAWNAIAGVPGDVADIYRQIWSYITAAHTLISWLFGFPLLQLARALLSHSSANTGALTAMLDAIARLKNWIWIHQVYPVYLLLSTRLTNLDLWARATFAAQWAHFELRYFEAIGYTNKLVSTERKQRTAAISAEHAAMLARVTWALQQVQGQASSGYNTGSAGRAANITNLLDDIVSRVPAVSDAERLLVQGVLDLAEIDDPLIRLGLGKLLTEIITKAGVDQATGDLVSLLFGSYAETPKAKNLYDAELDGARRITALETAWAQFMTKGGPEVEQAGQGWKDLTSVLVDAAFLSFTALAITDPPAWSTAVADTIGAAASDAMTGIVDLISHV